MHDILPYFSIFYIKKKSLLMIILRLNKIKIGILNKVEKIKEYKKIKTYINTLKKY